ncbi:MAG: phosphate ABC transporter substrate-binding protein [Gemmatimonadetes bacterium]|nr:phosphate ABC transporter substrate-binding protein [Gemmatimonadota bacterium]
MKRIIVALVAAFAFGAGPGQAQEFQVVVNPSSGTSEISAAELSKIFQKKSTKLPSGEAAKPVDLGKDSGVREAFSKSVHGRSTAQIESYWQQQIFAGKDVPPDQKASDTDVLAFVASTPGAIGYVSAGAGASGVKVVKVAG